MNSRTFGFAPHLLRTMQGNLVRAIGECYGVRMSDGSSVCAMGKHAVNTQSAISYPDSDVLDLSPVYHPQSTRTRQEPPNDGAHSSEWSVGEARRGEYKDSLGIKLETDSEEITIYFLLVSTPIRPPRP